MKKVDSYPRKPRETGSTGDKRRGEFSSAQLDKLVNHMNGGAIGLRQLQTAEFELRQAETKLEGARRSKKQYDAAQSLTW